MSNPKKFKYQAPRSPIDRAIASDRSVFNRRTTNDDNTPHPDAEIQRAKDFIKLLVSAQERSRSVERNPGIKRGNKQN